MSTLIPDVPAGASLDSITKRGTTCYLALLTTEVAPSVTLATLPEVTTSGYARQPVTFTVPAKPSSGEPMTTMNTALISWGPFTAAMLLDATHIALVSAATGTTGTVQYVWQLDQILTADINESIQIPVNKIAIAQN
jgi:hypothetical protein